MKECEIARDLMPNYIDGLTSKESNEYIEKHLETCNDCRNYLNEMKSSVELKGKETIKAEVDYMKKAKKKMRIGEKLVVIIGFLIIITAMLFWREIYQGILFVDICRKHLFWQEQVIEYGAYQLTQTDNDYMDVYYCNKEKTVIDSWSRNNGMSEENSNIRAVYNESDIPNSKIYVSNMKKQDDVRYNGATLKVYGGYDPKIGDPTKRKETAYLPFFTFEKASLWDLMKDFKDIVAIRIVDEGEYYLLYMSGGDEIKINRGSGLVESVNGYGGYTYYIFKIIDPNDERLKYPDDKEYIVLSDYEDITTRDKEETNLKISNCEEEAGTIVNYEFKVESNGNPDLTWFEKTNYENIRLLKITNNYTYKKMQERWSGLRDLTDEDFKHYFVLLIVDTDNSKDIHFKEFGADEESELNEQLAKQVSVTETEAQEDYLYSGNLIIIPNSLDVTYWGTPIFQISVKIEQ